MDHFSITRSSATQRPKVNHQSPKFYQLEHSEQVLVTTGNDKILGMDEMKINMNKNCGFTPEYKIIGGFNNNAIEVLFSKKDMINHYLSWICLMTFTGFQFKYTLNNYKTKYIFALADEDAYCYCNKNPCVECRFKCKNGFAVYAYWKDIGIYGKDISPFIKKVH